MTRRLRSAGWFAFFLFLGKGILWLILPTIVVLWNSAAEGANLLGVLP